MLPIPSYSALPCYALQAVLEEARDDSSTPYHASIRKSLHQHVRALIDNEAVYRLYSHDKAGFDRNKLRHRVMDTLRDWMKVIIVCAERE